MLEARFRPLPKWPGKLGGKNGQFRSGYTATLDRLEYELRRIRARDVIIEAGYRMEEIRNDGWPRGGSKPSHPGVILYCQTPDGPLRFASGEYRTMEQNIHAIALTLEALRAVDRYGATQAHEQYSGFKALPPATDAAMTTGWTLEDAAAWLSTRTMQFASGEILSDYDKFRRAYREAATAAHPDRGGDTRTWHALQAAEGLIEAHFKPQGRTQ